MNESRIAYIYDLELLQNCDRLPMVTSRASMVHDLITSYNLLSNTDQIKIFKSIPATDEELKYFHSTDYVHFLKDNNDKSVEDLEDYVEDELDELSSFGLIYDCYLLEKCYDLVKSIAGSSLTAAKLIVERKFDRVINWFGGWHHAQRDKAEGFCYVNDVVISIQYLSKEFKRILYIDLDVHHGNGVQNAFEFSKNILTMSLHKYSAGFYPNSGSLTDIGTSKGKYFSINIPLKDYISSDNYEYIFKESFKIIYDSYCPEIIVVQCGADIISEDKIGECNVSIESMSSCVKEILNKSIPSLFLGGGGYNFANTARYWTSLTSLILYKTISNVIPDTSQFFTHYTPSYELNIPKGLVRDKNSLEYLNDILNTIVKYGCMISNICGND